LNQAIGIALESRRLDKIKEAIERSNDLEAKLSYTFTIAQNIIKSKDLRNEILRLLLLIYEQRQGGRFDYYKIVKCQFFLSIPESTAILLGRIVSTEDYLIAYQIAFDILDNENQSFSKKVQDNLALQQTDGTTKERIQKL